MARAAPRTMARTRGHRTRVRPMRYYDRTHVRKSRKGRTHVCPGRPAMLAFARAREEPMDDITARQRRIIEFIRRTVRERGYPPTVREIGEAVGLASSSSVHAQLANLERRGLVKRDPTKPRAMELRGPGSSRRGGVDVPLVG